MPENFESLGIRLDTSEVKTGSGDLDKFAVSATNAEHAAEQITPASKAAGQAVRELGVAGSAAVPALRNSSEALKAAGISAKQYSQAMRLLPAQITDVVTSLASGSPAYLVAIQQGGQIRDSFGGIGASLRGLMSILTPARIAIGGTVASAALLAKAFNDGRQESFEYAKAIILSGNAAGVTKGQLADLARSVDDVVGTQAEAAATLARLASGGKVAGENLKEFTIVAQRLKQAVGQPIEETAKALEDLARRPAEASVKLNDQMHHLTIEVYRQIKALETQGRLFEAGEVAQKAFAAAADERSKKVEENLGTLQYLARGTGKVFKEMWDGILNVGRPVTLNQQADQIQQQIRELSAGIVRLDDDNGLGGVAGGRENRIRQLQDELRNLQPLIKAERERASAQAERTRKNSELIANEIEATKVEAARRAGLEQLAKLKLSGNVEDLQRSLAQSLSGYSAYTAQLEALRDRDLVSDKDYFAAKAALIQRDADARSRALRGEISLTQQENTRLESERTKATADPSLSSSERIRAGQPFTTEIVRNSQKIRDLEAEILRLRTESASALGVVNQEQGKAVDLATQQLQQARASAQAFLDVTQAQRARDLQSQGLGGRQREFNSGVDDIEDRFAEQRRRLEDQKTRGDLTQEQFDAQLKIAEEFRDKDRAGYEAYWSDLGKLQGSFFVGASEAFHNYIDDAQNVAELTQRAFENAFGSMEDAIVDFVSTGKLDFKSLADSVLSDIVRIQLKVLAAKALSGSSDGLLGILGSFIGFARGAYGGVGAGGGSASGGSVLYADTGIKRVAYDNQPAILHKGEAVLPASMNPWAGGSGLGGGSTVNITQHITTAPGTDVAQFRAIMQESKNQAVAEVYANLARNRWPLK